MDMKMAILPILIFTFCAVGYGQPTTGPEIMKLYKQQDLSKDATTEITMTIINDKGRERVRKLLSWTMYNEDGTRRQLMRFTQPADIAGTGFLSIENKGKEDDNWLYLPAIRKSRRISGSDKKDSFVGTDFSYEDLEPEKLAHFIYKRLKEETIDGIKTWVVEATPENTIKKNETSYGKRILWVTQDHHLIKKAEYYDFSGELLKIFTAGNIMQVPGSDKWRTYEMIIEDYLSGSRTRLEFDEIKINSGLSNSFFTQRFLERTN